MFLSKVLSLLLISNIKLVQLLILNEELTPGKECNRVCSENEKPKNCYFDWILEHYHTMGTACQNCSEGITSDCYLPQCVTGDGIEKTVMSINRQIPGPPIHVCKNDIIVVDMMNSIGGTATTMHWHGFHQRKTPYMDGVPFITQCPINFGNKFRYIFRATEPGTQFYHSHAGHHKVNGLYGGIVVREFLKNDLNSMHYDFDLPKHLIVLSDWAHHLAEMYMPGLVSRLNIAPDSILVNGLGRYFKINETLTTKTPLAVFSVKAKFRYRFRLVNSASHNCQYQMQVQNHSFQVIATDSYSTQPITVNTLTSSPGERFDFIINANQSIGNYLIKFRAIGFCEMFNLVQYAILKYVGNNETVHNNIFNESMITDFDKIEDIELGRVLNDPSAASFENGNLICVGDMQSYKKTNITLLKPDHKFVLKFANYPVHFNLTSNYSHFMTVGKNIQFVGAINNITFKFPSFPLLTQPHEITNDTFCDEAVMKGKCLNQICECVHRIKVELNSIVELILVDDGSGSVHHPFHLHGYPFRVIGMGNLKDKNINLQNQLKSGFDLDWRNLITMPKNHIPPEKDTIMIHGGGYTILRFHATNPGFWLMHCHFEWHMAIGMGLVLQVGEISEMVKTPKHFTKCRDFKLNLLKMDI